MNHTKSLSRSGHDISRLSQQEIAELASHLNPEERSVLLNQGTEPAFCGVFLDNHQEGTYTCRLCGLPLFHSSTKFDSGTGWPSFYQPVDLAHIELTEDRTHGMVRNQVQCARCGGHLGHVFSDGPPPTGERHCLNSLSLEFIAAGSTLPQKTASDQARAGSPR